MKKILSTLVVAAMAATLTVGLTACGNDETKHAHDYATAWSSDETNHWHACTAAGDCDAPKKDEAAHTWNDGEITTPATATSDGVKTFTCTACQKTKTESVKYVVVLTEATDYDALVSEKVTEQEWKNAFKIDNVTVKIQDNINGKSADFVLIDAPAYNVCGDTVTKDDNGNITTVFDGEQKETFEPTHEEYAAMSDLYNFYSSSAYPDFSDFFSSFEYNDAQNAYVMNKKVMTNAILEYWQFTYDFATVKIINGKLAFVRCGNHRDIKPYDIFNDYSEFLYNFGTTQITL